MYLGNVAVVFVALFYVAVLAAYFLSIRILTDIIQMKGFSTDRRWPLYLVGTFATPVVLGLIAIAVPDRQGR